MRFRRSCFGFLVTAAVASVQCHDSRLPPGGDQMPSGLSHSNTSEIENPPSAKYDPLTAERIERIAIEHLRNQKRLYDRYEVSSRFGRDDNWRVIISRIPARPGSYRVVILNTNGDIIRTMGGQ